MPAGYSGTPLSKKLGYKPGMSVYLSGAPANYRTLLAPLPDGVRFLKTPGKSLALAHAFVTTGAELGSILSTLQKAIAADGAIWISWPKKSSGVKSGVGEGDIRKAALATGLVDVKVCAVDEIWSGLKLVIPVARRKAERARN
jgi:hypothetical protein